MAGAEDLSVVFPSTWGRIPVLLARATLPVSYGSLSSTFTPRRPSPSPRNTSSLSPPQRCCFSPSCSSRDPKRVDRLTITPPYSHSKSRRYSLQMQHKLSITNQKNENG